MDTPRACFLQAIQLPPDLQDEDCTNSISKLISLAASDQPHSVSLKDVHDAVSRYEFETYLEPLDVLPALLPCRHDGATDLIRLCANNNSAKEIMIVLQEQIEYLQTCLNRDADEEKETDSDLAQRAIGIVLLCAPAISQSRLGKRSALELCLPILENVTSLVSSIAPLSTKEQGRMFITHVANMVKDLNAWTSTVTNTNERREVKSLLRGLLDTTVVSCAPSIQAYLAVRAAQYHFPRSFVRSEQKVSPDGKDAMLAAEITLDSLKGTLEMVEWKPGSFSDLVYQAHSTKPLPLSPSSVPDLHRLLVSALQMNVVIDEALYLFFTTLTKEDTSLSPVDATSLCTVFTALASTHLDPTIRQLNLCLLSLTLSKLPPPPRLEMLFKLTTDEDFPQIRGPAVGLVKEAVLEALTLPTDQASRNPFASPELLRIFGGVLFRPNPPDFFGDKKTREELAQSLELLRIADCLSFYYVLLQRDRENKTGVRSKDTVACVEGSILRPLRQFLDEHIGGEDPPLMAVLSLQIGLSRIDDALQILDVERNT